MLKLAYSGTVCLVLNLYCCICLCLHSWLCNRTSQMYLFCKCVTVVSCTAIWFPGLRSYLYLSGCTQMWPWYCDLAQAQASRGLCPWYPCLLSYFWFQFLVITISSLSYSHKFMHLLHSHCVLIFLGKNFPLQAPVIFWSPVFSGTDFSAQCLHCFCNIVLTRKTFLHVGMLGMHSEPIISHCTGGMWRHVYSSIVLLSSTILSDIMTESSL